MSTLGTKMSDITITYSVYGTFDINRLIASIKSVKEQKGCSVDIIVSERNEVSQLEKLAESLRFKLVFSKQELFEGREVYRPGEIRNKAIDCTESELIYLNDADIIFQNPYYLLNLCNELNDGDILIWPPARRLLIGDVMRFIQELEHLNVQEVLKVLKNPNEYVANFDGDKVELKVVSHNNGRVYTTDIETFNRYMKDESMKGKEPTFWHDIVHIGAIFTRTDLVRSVGSYSDSYITWGYEDVDLQWKLSELFRTRLIPKEEKFEVLHLDHEKNYFSMEHNLKNRLIFEKRQREGVKKAIENDLRSGGLI